MLNYEEGGANLLVNEIQPLYQSGFKGSTLGNIVNNIESGGIAWAINQMQNNKDFSGISQSTCESVVYWAQKRLKNKQYYDWTSCEVSEKLVAQSRKGASLSQKESEILLNYGFDGDCLEEVVQSVKNREENDALFKCIQTLLNLEEISDEVKKILISVKVWVEQKLVVQVQFFQTVNRIHEATIMPYDFEQDPYVWIDKRVGLSLKECFEERLDKPYHIDRDKRNITGFYRRERFTARVQDFVKGNVEHFFQNKEKEADRKTSFTYGIIANGTGNGKTRACREIQNIIYGMDLNTSFNVNFRKLHCFFPLDNNYSLDSMVETQDPDQDVSEGKIIGFRILCSIYGKSAQHVRDCLQLYFPSIYKDTDLFCLRSVVERLGSFLNNEILLLSIAIDEIQTLMQHFGTKWKRPAYSVGVFMVDTTQPNANLKNVCLVPIISGVATDETMRFPPTEYGNTVFSLPPLSAFDMNKILPEYFNNWKFLYETPMISAFKIDDQTIQNLSVMILEALIIPNVLRITLSTICSILAEYWSSNCQTIVPIIQNKVQQAIRQYLPNFYGPRSLLTNILSCQEISLEDEQHCYEKQQFGIGRLYLTSFDTLYVPSHYFDQLLIDNDPFISLKLPKIASDIQSRNFEQIDLKCICHRLDFLKDKDNISVKKLFPGCKSVVKDVFKVDSTMHSELKFQKRFIFAMKKQDNTEVEVKEDDKEDGKIFFDVRVDLCNIEPFTVYTYTVSNHPAVDGHFCLQDSNGTPSVFLIQYRHYKLKSALKPMDWLTKGDFAKRAVEAFKNKHVKAYFVFITTTTISQQELLELEKSEYYKQLVIIYHEPQDSPAIRYFPPNLLPYYTMFLFNVPGLFNSQVQH